MLGGLVTVARPRDATSEMFIGDYDTTGLVPVVYAALVPRLSAHDIDQEIKECSIVTVGKLVYHFGDELAAELPTILSLLRRRLDNEVTRIVTLRVITTICLSPLRLDIGYFVAETIVDIARFTRQQNRVLKQTTCSTLDAIISSHAVYITVELVAAVLHELAVLISDTDLFLSHLALKTTSSAFGRVPGAGPAVRSEILAPAIELVASSLLQGPAQTSLVQLFQTLVEANPPAEGMDFGSLLALLVGRCSAVDLSKQSALNLSKCISGICVSANAVERAATVRSFASDLSGSNPRAQHMALLCLGELGRQTELADSWELKDLILAAFESPSEEVKTAAAFALGGVAVGNMAMYLPVLLQAVESSKHQYLLLAALKEVIVVHVNSALSFEAYLSQVG